LTFMDSVGLGLIARLHATGRTRGVQVRLIGVSVPIRHVIEIAGMDRICGLS